MRRRVVIVAGVALLVVGVVVGLIVARRDSTSTATSAKSGSGLVARSVTVRSITVKVRPAAIDETGARFVVSFDTHTRKLNLDVAANANLVVDGKPWKVEAWKGDVPGGHHREGELRFVSGGPATGAAKLTIGGMGDPVEFSWTLPTA